MSTTAAAGTTPTTVAAWPEDAAGVLAAARERRRVADRAEADLCRLAVEWALMNPALDQHPDRDRQAATYTWRTWGGGVVDIGIALAGEGAPKVAEYAVPEFAGAVGLSTEAGKCYLGEALELAYRLPRTWRRVCAGEVAAWRARRVASRTLGLNREAAAYVDGHVAGVVHKVGPAQLDRTVNEAIGRFMPEEVARLADASWDKRHVTIHDQLVSFTGTMRVEAELDIPDALDLEAAVAAGAEQRAALGSVESLDVRRAQAVGDLARGQAPLDLAPGSPPADRRGGRKVKPRQVVLHVHVSDAALHDSRVDQVARLERGNSLVTVDQVRTWCGRADTQVVVKPVIDLAECTWTDSDEVPEAIKEKVALRDRTCVFPWCTRPARRCRPDEHEHPCDNDHAHPRSQNGATCSCNIAPLCRRHHRLKTHSPWSYVVVDPGTYVWTSPHGYQFLRDPTGTLDVSADRPRLRVDGTREPTPPDT